MRNLRLVLSCMVCMLIAFSGYSQDRKAERAARKEQRRIERAIMDSLRLHKAEKDSVNVGYGYQKRKDMNTSVSRLGSNRNEMASYSNMAEYLMGRVPGLQVIKSGDGYQYLIRGMSSNYGPTDPLLLVDGVQVDNFDSVNPADVESVEVLKDAASASMYGAQGGCGVILVTLRKVR